MNGGSLKWFIALSVAVHAVLLVTWMPPETDAGNPGRVIHLEMVEIVGSRTASAEPVADRAPEPAAVTPNTPARTTEAAAVPPAGKPETGDRVAASPLAEKREPSPAVAASSPERSRQASDQHLRNSILELVATNLKYPPVARRKGWQGTVVLKLRIEANGRISRLHVNKTSGYPVLDQAAVESLQLASVPQAGQWLNGEAVDIVVPVEYRLVDSRV